MDAYRDAQSAPSSVMTLEILAFGLTNSGLSDPSIRDTTWLEIGWVTDTDLPWQNGNDTSEYVTFTSGQFGGGLVIGLGGTPAEGWPPQDPAPRASFEPPPSSIAQIPAGALFPGYAIWVGPAWLRLYFQGANAVCEWWDHPPGSGGGPVIRDTFPASPLARYAGLRSTDHSIGPDSQTGAVYLGEWKVTGGASGTAPYPFATQQGALVTGPGAAGTLRIS